jgi:hypothetical protein
MGLRVTGLPLRLTLSPYFLATDSPHCEACNLRAILTFRVCGQHLGNKVLQSIQGLALLADEQTRIVNGNKIDPVFFLGGADRGGSCILTRPAPEFRASSNLLLTLPPAG